MKFWNSDEAGFLSSGYKCDMRSITAKTIAQRLLFGFPVFLLWAYLMKVIPEINASYALNLISTSSLRHINYLRVVHSGLVHVHKWSQMLWKER